MTWRRCATSTGCPAGRDHPGTTTLCPWHSLTHSGIVSSARGLLIAGFYASPPDAASATEDEREQIARAVSRAYLAFGTGTAIWNDVAETQEHVEFDAERIWLVERTVLTSWHAAFAAPRSSSTTTYGSGGSWPRLYDSSGR